MRGKGQKRVWAKLKILARSKRVCEGVKEKRGKTRRRK